MDLGVVMGTSRGGRGARGGHMWHTCVGQRGEDGGGGDCSLTTLLHQPTVLACLMSGEQIFSPLSIPYLQ